MEPINFLLVVSLGAAVLVDLAAPFLLAAFLARRCQGQWRYWLYGLLVFLVFQGLTRIPAMLLLQSHPAVKAALKQPAFLGLFLFLAAASAGLFEEGGRWLAFRLVIPPEQRKWQTALMLGAGHGGLEAIGVGFAVLAGLVGYLAVMLLPSETFAGWAGQIAEVRKQFAQLQGWEPLLGGWERLAALAIQVGLTVMVLQAFVRGRRWWWYALGVHTLVDFTTVGCLQVVGKSWGQATSLLAVEGLATVYALAALWFTSTMRPQPPKPVGEQEQRTEPGGDGDTALHNHLPPHT